MPGAPASSPATTTHCPEQGAGPVLEVAGANFPTNRRGLCEKGLSSAELLADVITGANPDAEYHGARLATKLRGKGAMADRRRRCRRRDDPQGRRPGDGEVVMCPLHNHRFSLTDGSCATGADPVAAYTATAEDGELVVRLR